MFEGGFREEVVQQCGYRMPVASDYEEGTNSGLWLAVADPGATVTGLGVATSIAEKVVVFSRSEAQGNASSLGKVFVARFGARASNPSDAQELMGHACRFSGRYGIGAG